MQTHCLRGVGRMPNSGCISEFVSNVLYLQILTFLRLRFHFKYTRLCGSKTYFCIDHKNVLNGLLLYYIACISSNPYNTCHVNFRRYIFRSCLCSNKLNSMKSLRHIRLPSILHIKLVGSTLNAQEFLETICD